MLIRSVARSSWGRRVGRVADNKAFVRRCLSSGLSRTWQSRLDTCSKNLVLGCVCYDPAVGDIWGGIQQYLVHEAQVPFDYVLFTNYEAQVQALVQGNIDVAWNGPIAHVLAEQVCPPDQQVWSLGMRDVDRDMESIVVVRKGSGRNTLSGRVVLTGASDSPQSHVVPLYHLQATLGLSFQEVIAHDYDLGKHGDTAVGEIKAMERLLREQNGNGVAAVVSRMMWDRAWQGLLPSIDAKLLTETYEELTTVPLPTFDHCQFDALSGKDHGNNDKQAQLEDFGQALFAMDWENSEHQRLLKLEGIRKEWVEPRQSGYDIVRQAMRGIPRGGSSLHRPAVDFHYGSPGRRQQARSFSSTSKPAFSSSRTSPSPRVAVIGAGVAGLQTLRALRGAGLDVTALEASHTVGGVWQANYENFGVQVPRQLYEFQDYPMTQVPWGQLATGVQVQSYLEDFVDHFNLRDLIRFNTKVTSVKQQGDAASWTVETTSTSNNNTREEIYDYLVVATGLYSNRNKFIPPELRLHNNVIHSAEFTDRSVAKGKKVVVIGGGKSAIDCAIQAAKAGASSVTMVQRESHWPTPLYIAGVIPFQYIFLSRLGQALVSTHTAPLPGSGRAINAFANSAVGPLLMKPVFRAVEELFAVQFGLRGPLRPQADVCRDFYDVAAVLDGEFKEMRQAGKIDVVLGAVKGVDPNDNSLGLEDGSVLADVDLVVSATGFQQDYSIFDAKLQNDLGCTNDDGLYFYRGILPNTVPNMAFVGYVLAASNIMSYGLQAEWLARHLVGEMPPVTTQAMQQDIDARQKWARSWMPRSSRRGMSILLHQTHYHDQLLKDMGVNPHRKMPNILAEMFMPYEPADYNGIIGNASAGKRL